MYSIQTVIWIGFTLSYKLSSTCDSVHHLDDLVQNPELLLWAQCTMFSCIKCSLDESYILI